jgi:hypothetical protein
MKSRKRESFFIFMYTSKWENYFFSGEIEKSKVVKRARELSLEFNIDFGDDGIVLRSFFFHADLEMQMWGWKLGAY